MDQEFYRYLNFKISKRFLAIPWSNSQNIFINTVRFAIGPFLSGLSKIRQPLTQYWDFKSIPGDSVIYSQNFFFKMVRFVIWLFLSGLSKIRHPLYINGSRILPLSQF